MKGLGILCSGQGNQHPEMFDLLDGDEAAGKVLSLAANLLGSPPAALARKADSREFFRNALAQPLISTLQLATGCNAVFAFLQTVFEFFADLRGISCHEQFCKQKSPATKRNGHGANRFF